MDDHNELAVAADVIVDLIAAEVIPGEAARRAGAAVGVDYEALTAAVERWHRREKRARSLTAMPYIYNVYRTTPPDAPAPAALTPPTPAASTPAPAATSAAPTRPSQTPAPVQQPRSSGVDPIAGRAEAVRNGFYLPTGEHVTFLAATAAQHLARAEWLHTAADLAEAAAEFHETAASAISATTWARCLADLPEQHRPELPAAVPA